MIEQLKYQEQSVIKWNNIARSKKPSVEEQEAITQEELIEFRDAIADNNMVNEIDALCDVFVTASYLEVLDPTNSLVKTSKIILQNAIEEYGFNFIQDCIKEVLRSNWTKFTPTGEVEDIDWFIDMSCEHIEKHTEYTMVSGAVKIADKHLNVVVFTDGNNKVMKPRDYSQPDLMKIINKHLGEFDFED